MSPGHRRFPAFTRCTGRRRPFRGPASQTGWARLSRRGGRTPPSCSSIWTSWPIFSPPSSAARCPAEEKQTLWIMNIKRAEKLILFSFFCFPPIGCRWLTEKHSELQAPLPWNWLRQMIFVVNIMALCVSHARGWKEQKMYWSRPCRELQLGYLVPLRFWFFFW